MTRRAPRVGVLAVAGALAATTLIAARQNPPASPQQPQRPVFRTGANVVLVDVYPVQDGKIVEGLQASDFQLFENGKPQQIEQFEFVKVEPSPEGERRDPHTVAESRAQAADPYNRLFVVYLDHFHTNVTGSHTIQKPLVELLDQVLAPNDLFGVATPRMRPQDVAFGRRTASLERQLADNWIWGWRQSFAREPDEKVLEKCFMATEDGIPRFGRDGVATRPLGEVILARRREMKVLAHLEELIDYLGKLREARKAILLFTNGWVLYEPDHGAIERILGEEPRLPAIGQLNGRIGVGDNRESGPTAWCNAELQTAFMHDGPRRMRELLDRANRNNVTFYPVNPSGIEIWDTTLADNPKGDGTALMLQSLDRVQLRSESLRTAAGNTDGIAVITNDLRAGLRRVVDDLSGYYLLSYSSTNSKADGSYRRIEVKVARPDVRVRARRGYVAPDESSLRSIGATASAPAAPPGLDDALAALVRLHRGTELFAQASIEESAALIAVELPASRVVTGAPFARGAEVAVTVTGANLATASATGRIAAGSRGVLVTVPFASPPGTTPLHIDVEITGAERLDLRFEATRRTSAIAGDVVAYRGLPAGTVPLRAAADFQYRRTERVRLEWPLRAAPARRQARLLTRQGQPLPVPVTLTEVERDGRRFLAADLLPAPLGEGDYVVELTVGTGEASETRHVAVRVTR
jgi:VWFA-related protein